MIVLSTCCPGRSAEPYCRSRSFSPCRSGCFGPFILLELIRQQRLCPGRIGHAGGLVGQERHPHRRVRHPEHQADAVRKRRSRAPRYASAPFCRRLWRSSPVWCPWFVLPVLVRSAIRPSAHPPPGHAVGHVVRRGDARLYYIFGRLAENRRLIQTSTKHLSARSPSTGTFEDETPPRRVVAFPPAAAMHGCSLIPPRHVPSMNDGHLRCRHDFLPPPMRRAAGATSRSVPHRAHRHRIGKQPGDARSSRDRNFEERSDGTYWEYLPGSGCVAVSARQGRRVHARGCR